MSASLLFRSQRDHAGIGGSSGGDAATLTEVYGNGSSIHYFGRTAGKKLDEARRKVAASFGAGAEEIVFTRKLATAIATAS